MKIYFKVDTFTPASLNLKVTPNPVSMTKGMFLYIIRLAEGVCLNERMKGTSLGT